MHFGACVVHGLDYHTLAMLLVFGRDRIKRRNRRRIPDVRGFRLYTDTDLDRLILIRRMKPLGFTLDVGDSSPHREICRLRRKRKPGRKVLLTGLFLWYTPRDLNPEPTD